MRVDIFTRTEEYLKNIAAVSNYLRYIHSENYIRVYYTRLLLAAYS